jgi:hypothetical protein
MAKVELITQAEYARRRGVDPTSVRDAVRGQRITLIDGKIDPVVADAQWQANTRKRVAIGDEIGALRIQAAAPSASPPPASPPPDGWSGYVPDYQESRARREAAEAELAELRLAEEQGDLIRTDAVRSAYSRRVASLREALMQIPARLSPVLAAADGNTAMIHDQLMAELRQVLLQVTEPT